MATWAKIDGEWVWTEPTEPTPPPTLNVSENPVVAELLDAKGRVIRQVQEREPFGFRAR